MNDNLPLNLGFLINDEPVEALNEELKPLSTTLSRLLNEQLQEQKPVVRSFLIAGDWGTGKTSVLNRLRAKFDDQPIQGTDKQVQVIFFEAWRYEYEDNLMSALLWKMVTESKVYKDSPKDSAIRIATDYLLSGLLKGLSKVSVKDLVEGRALLSEERRKDRTSKFVGDFVSTDKFINGFNDLIKKLYPNNRLVFLIDDLDRCSPESAVTLLDHIRMLIHITEATNKKGEDTKNDKNNDKKKEQEKNEDSFFVVAMDKVTLKQAINHKFSDLSSYDSNRYLEKLFPVTLHLTKACIDFNQLNIPNIDKVDESLNDKIKEVFSHSYFRNTRLMKRCLNQVYIYQVAMQVEGNTPEKSNRKEISSTMLEWLAAINRWPELRSLIVVKDPLFWEELEQVLVGKKLFEDINTSSISSLVLDSERQRITDLLRLPGLIEFLVKGIQYRNRIKEVSLSHRMDIYREVDNVLRECGL